MTKFINWPTAAIVLGFAAAHVTLTVLGHPVPDWLTGSLAVAGTIFAGYAKQLVKPPSERDTAPELPDAEDEP